MSILAVVLLAFVQGITEFLPVSSSGHLALGGLLLRIPQEDIIFEVVVHTGTLMAVLAVYWKDLAALVRGVFSGDRGSLGLAGLLALASIPAAMAGYFLEDGITAFFRSPVAVSCFLILTGTVLFTTRFMKAGDRNIPTPRGSLLVGFAQAMALLPGISRSGFTISAGLFSGIRRQEAARFSFLLSIPAISGAAFLKLGEAGSGDTAPLLLIVGFAVSAVTGYISLRLLLKFLRAGRFSSFAWYCWFLGLAGLVLSLRGG